MMKYLSLLLALIQLTTPLTPAFADGDPELCAAVLPCDLFGGVLPQFADPSSPCFPRYQRQCAAHAARINLLDEYANDLARQVARLRQSNRNLRRENRRLTQAATARARP